MLVLGYLRIARSLECFQDDLSSLDQSLRTRGTSYHVLKDVELQGTDMDWGSPRLWHRMLLLRIAFPLILSYLTLLCYFRVAVLAFCFLGFELFQLLIPPRLSLNRIVILGTLLFQSKLFLN